MSDINIIEYFEKKIELLEHCLNLNEKFFKTVDNLEHLNELIDQRGSLLLDLDALNVEVKDDKNYLSNEQNERVDRLVSLLLDQDHCLLGILDEIRSDLLKSIKSTVSNRSMANKYTLNYNPAPNGSYLNYSK